MRVLVIATALATVVLGINTADSTTGTITTKHDFRPCAGTLCDGEKDIAKAAMRVGTTADSLDDDLKGKYPWFTGVELGKAGAPIKIEAWLAYTCPGCAEHWKDVWQPLINKYGDRVSFVHQPFALPYQPFSYETTQAAYAVYRLSGNDPKAFREWSNTMFKNQMFVYNSWDMTVKQVWERIASFAEPLGIKAVDVMNAMNGTITTTNYDAWYQARYARQRTLPGAPTFVVNGWIPSDLPVGGWSVNEWSKWIDANL